MAQIFISYRRADSQANTDRIYERLVQAFGREAIFKDVDNIPLGMHFPSHLENVIRDSKVVLVIVGRSWTTIKDDEGNLRLHDPEDFVRIEVEAALSLKNAVVIPVLVNGAQMPKEDDLPDSLKPMLSLNAIGVDNDPEFTTDVARLIDGLAELGIKRVRTANQMHILQGLAVVLVLAIILGGLGIAGVFSGDDSESTPTRSANVATATRTPSEPTRTPTTEPTVVDCEFVLEPRLTIGDTAHVTPGLPNVVRSEPDPDASLEGMIPGGHNFKVLGGPTCNDGMGWWLVEYKSIIGWTAEGSGETYYLEP